MSAKMKITDLNQQFGLGEILVFKTVSNGAIIADISNEQASATIALQGAHLMHWKPTNSEAVIWRSPDAKPTPGKSIRGGVPICWPWFGAHPAHASFPAHGFARTTDWAVINSTSLPNGATQITFELMTENIPADQWPHAAMLQCRFTVGNTLAIELTTRNLGTTEHTISEALHTYFAVSDIRNITIDGLDGCHYLDKVDDMRQKQQTGEVRFSSEVDRIYINTTADCIIRDSKLSRQIRINKTGSQSTIVWNPWIEKSAQMGDMGTNGYLEMVCVESANAANNSVIIPAGNEHRLTVNYSIEAITDT